MMGPTRSRGSTCSIRPSLCRRSSAFHTGNLVPGIEATNDPLMQARLFSYLDTQLTRLGGPNFTQLPINRPQAPVNDMLRDGMHQTAVHTGLAPYRPNSIDDGQPLEATEKDGAYVQVPRKIEGETVRGAPASFDDHFSQAALFFRSMTEIEQSHIVEAYSFELGKVFEKEIRERQLASLANIDADLCQQVADALGMPAPAGEPPNDVTPSPTLSQVVSKPGLVAGRKLGVIASAGSDIAAINRLKTAMDKVNVSVLVIAPVGGELKKGRTTVVVDRTGLTARSIEFDAIIVADGTDAGRDLKRTLLLQEAHHHCKTLAGWGSGAKILADAGVPLDGPGVLVEEKLAQPLIGSLRNQLGLHRVWERAELLKASEAPPAV
jgi:catalase